MDVPTTGEFVPPGSNNEISGTGYQILLAEVDPTTGLPRLIVGNLTGIYSGLDNNGAFETTIGSSTATPAVNRNGNLDLAQFYYGAVQPSSAAAQVAGALFYGGAQNIGGQASDPNLLTDGDLQWTQPSGRTSPLTSRQSTPAASSPTPPAPPSTSRAAAPSTSTGPPARAAATPISSGQRRRPDLRAAPGQQRRTPPPTRSGRPTSYANIVVNPVNEPGRAHQLEHRQHLRDHEPGRDLVRHRHAGDLRQPRPTARSFALAFGAPDPSAPEGVGNLGNFVYVGTATGQIYVSQNAGGNWTNISPASTAPPSSRSSPIPPGAATTPTPSPPPASSTWPNSILLARTPPPRRRGSTSPAASRPWPIPSSARATTRRPTPTPCRTTWPRSSTRSRPTGTTRSPIIPTTSARDITRSCTSPPTRASTCRPTTARPGPSSPTRPSAPWPRAATCPTSTSPT